VGVRQIDSPDRTDPLDAKMLQSASRIEKDLIAYPDRGRGLAQTKTPTIAEDFNFHPITLPKNLFREKPKSAPMLRYFYFLASGSRKSNGSSMARSEFEVLLNMGVLSEEEGVSDETRRILAEKDFTEVLTLEEETLLIRQGSKPEALFFTIDGTFHAISHANPEAPNRLLGRIESGQFIGEVCLVDPKSKASPSVKAFPQSMVLKMKPEAFGELCEAHPAAANEFLLAVSRQLAKRLREANERVL